MPTIKSYMKIVFATIMSIIEYFFGGFDTGMSTLIAFMIVDVITGFIKAYLGKSEKSSRGYLDSEIMWKGGVKKGVVFIVIYVSAMTCRLLTPESTLIRDFTVTYYAISEALSILENAVACGIYVPEPLKQILDKSLDSSKNS